jgi:hypothetical protein
MLEPGDIPVAQAGQWHPGLGDFFAAQVIGVSVDSRVRYYFPAAGRLPEI